VAPLILDHSLRQKIPGLVPFSHVPDLLLRLVRRCLAQHQQPYLMQQGKNPLRYAKTLPNDPKKNEIDLQNHQKQK